MSSSSSLQCNSIDILFWHEFTISSFSDGMQQTETLNTNYCATLGSFIISTKWTEWNWRIYCFHFCVYVHLCALSLKLCTGRWSPKRHRCTACCCKSILRDIAVLTEMYSTRAWKVDNISVRTIHRWKLRFIGFLKMQSSLRSMFEFARNLLIFNTYFRRRSSIAATWGDMSPWLW